MAPYQVSAEAQSDLFEIWYRIATDSVDLANRIEQEFYDLFPPLRPVPVALWLEFGWAQLARGSLNSA